MASFSTGLKQSLLDSNPFDTIMNGGFIHIYAFNGSSTIPSPDAAVDGTDYLHLATISASGGTDSTGLNFASPPVAGVISKDSGQTWSNVTTQNEATDTAAFFVHVGSTEHNPVLSASTTAPRIVGTVGLAGTDMVLQSVDLVENEDITLSFYNLTIGG